jgi:hypothetical protein
MSKQKGEYLELLRYSHYLFFSYPDSPNPGEMHLLE